MRRWVAALALVFGAVIPATAGKTASPHFTTAAGLRVLGVQRLDPRSYDVTVLSADLGRPVHVRILLPSSYADHPAKRYPVLYLFHGTSGRASDWEETGDAERTT